MRSALASLLLAATCSISPPAHAVAQRTFVASYGLTANTAFNCSIVKPCRAFSEAIGVTTPGGEVIVLDSAGYGPVTITQSVSIIAPSGVYAGISVFSGNGITLNTAGIDVVLNGLTINGLGGANGILMTNGASLRIENCTVAGFASAGTAAINISAAAQVFISDTVVAKSNIGIALDGGANVAISRVNAVNNVYQGIAMIGASDATTVAAVSDSVASGNGNHGFVVVGNLASTAGGFPACSSCVRKMTVARSVASGNLIGMGTVSSGSATTLTVDSSVVSYSSYVGLDQFGGTLKSAQNNALTDNATAVSGALTTGGIVY